MVVVERGSTQASVSYFHGASCWPRSSLKPGLSRRQASPPPPSRDRSGPRRYYTHLTLCIGGARSFLLSVHGGHHHLLEPLVKQKREWGPRGRSTSKVPQSLHKATLCQNRDSVATTLGTVNHKCLQRIQPHYRRRAKAHRPDAGTTSLDRCTHEVEEVELVCGLHARKSDVHPLPYAPTSSIPSMRRRGCGGELHLLVSPTNRILMKLGQSVGVSVAFISAAVRASPPWHPASTIHDLSPPYLLQYEG